MALQAVMRLVRDGTLIGGGDAVAIGDYIVADPSDVTGPPGSILEPLIRGLLLVEEFDRLDIEDRDALAAWVARRGPFEFEPNRANTRRPSEAGILLKTRCPETTFSNTSMRSPSSSAHTFIQTACGGCSGRSVHGQARLRR